MKITIRPERKNDYGEIKKITDLAFGQVNEGIIIENLRDNPDYIAKLSLVAIIDNKIVGHILFFPVAITNDWGKNITLSLGPMAVHPDFQKKGIGSKLINEGFKIARKLGYQSSIVVGHPSYYPRFGFKPARNWYIRLSFDVPDEAFMAIELTPNALKKCSGMIEYPKEFLEAM
jgi:predicted N-acetyltransferase YhbS